MNATERTAWLGARRAGLGATDIASLCGIGFATPTEVYRSKVGPAADADDAHPLLKIGLATEALNASLYTARTGVELRKPAAIDRHTIHPWAAASLDWVTTAVTPVETKYTPFFGDRWGEEFTEEVPDAYLVQVQWQMFVTANETADVSVLSGTGDHRVYRVPRSEPLIGLLLDVGRRFWVDHVLAETPPPADWCERFAGAVTERLAVDPTYEPVLGPEAAALAEEYRAAKGVVKDAEAVADDAKAKLLDLMGDAAKATAGPYTLTRSIVEGGKEVAYITKPHVRFQIREPKKPKGDS